MVKVLLIGNGAREHALAEALARSPQKPEIYSFMKANNPGIAKLSKEVILSALHDEKNLLDFVTTIQPDFAVIGPEAPLEAGIADLLESLGIPCVGPLKELAKLETSKAFTRDLMKKYDIEGQPKFKVFTHTPDIETFMEELGGEFVVKADGLMGGKGVKVSGEHLKDIKEGVLYCEKCILKDGKVVVEEKFVGQEFSLMSLCDGKHVVDTPPVQDHKRAFVGDKGPNTGGMGSYSDADHSLPFLKKEDVKEAHMITQKVCDALRKDTGKEYKGILYGGFIATKKGVKVIEYNARFGDPEAMNVLPILKSDFVKVCQAIGDGTLDKVDVEFEKKATVCKYVVPNGYPDDPVGGEKIELTAEDSEAKVYYASVDEREDGLFMSSSRSVAFVGIADSIEDAEEIAEKAAAGVKGPVFHRPDIGTKELIKKRIEHMKELRE